MRGGSVLGSSLGSGPGPGFGRKLSLFGLNLILAAAVVGTLGLLRLGRQFPAATDSPTLLVPFLLPVLALSLEAGALVAGLAAQLGVLLWGVGAPRNARARLLATLPVLVPLGLVLGAAQLIPRGTEHPGAFANALVQSARSSCEGPGDKPVPVPLLGLDVSCGEPRRIAGPLPGVKSVQLAMRELTFSDDLRRVDIAGLELDAARSPHVHLAVSFARVAGIAPWSRSPRLSTWARFLVLWGLCGVLWVVAGVGFRPRAAATGTRAGAGANVDAAAEVAAPRSASASASGRPSSRLRWLGHLLLMTPGAAAAAGFISLDLERAAPLAYGLAALLGVAALGLLGIVGRRLPQIFTSFSAS